MTDAGPEEAVCRNCGAILVGEFCHACGQKRFVESDRRFSHLLHQFIAGATDLDGRFWRTMRALLFQPGLLSREYFEGRRTRWLSPVSLFLAVSVIYFLAPIRGGDLTQEFNQQVPPEIRAQALGPDEVLSEAHRAASGQWYSQYAARWIERRVRERDAAARVASNGGPSPPSMASGALGLLPGEAGYSFRDYRVAYDAKANDVSKALVVLHAPVAALALLLMFARQRRYYAEHFVFALHYLAVWLISLQLILQVSNLVSLLPASLQPPEAAYDWMMRTLLPAYAVLAVRRAYGVGWVKATMAAVGLVAAIVIFNLYVYHVVQFMVTFALT
jgi:hypothetical protein